MADECISQRGAGGIATYFYLSGTWYNATARRIDERVSTRRRSADRLRAPDHTRAADANFETTSSNPVDLKLPRNGLCGPHQPLHVRLIRIERRARRKEVS